MTPEEIERAISAAQFGLLGAAAGELAFSSTFAGTACLISSLYLEKAAIYFMQNKNNLFSFFRNEAAATHLAENKTPLTKVADTYVSPAFFKVAQAAKPMLDKIVEKTPETIITRLRRRAGM
ncbi:MAG: hypothetical protein P4M12_11605 [Gammaproteobacteria bacterium]|nr:hypothetical protein [Gammaproteobacteria bacterium]